ncbi:MAG TPA: VOC family protein [Candidatus Saccharimonadales bacterium]|nr:VOC family protein [Candidatus Saccharimonadales bacterium]
MGNINLVPYLFFNGQCKEAMEFYKKIFGGNLDVQTMAEVPAETQKAAGNSDPNRVMHAKLVSGQFTLMGSDSPKASSKAAKIELSLNGDDEAELQKIFDGLGNGGEVRMPLEKQFWGDKFGALTDKYNVDWMVNIAGQKQ